MAGSVTAGVTVGVLAMQGAFAEHARALGAVGLAAVEVRTPAELAAVGAIVLPGGESTAIRKALDRCHLLEPLRRRIEAGMPTFGTCAGMIVLADTAPGGDRAEAGTPPCFGLLDVVVERNGFGRQVHSFEAPVELEGGERVTGVFIRAPRLASVGQAATVVGRIAEGRWSGEPVAVRQGSVLAASFHPELTHEPALHEHFRAIVVEHTAIALPG